MHKTGQSNSNKPEGMGKHPNPIPFYQTAALLSLTGTEGKGGGGEDLDF